MKHIPKKFGIKQGAEKFPLMVVVSVTYVCNGRCPHCPYTNSAIRSHYKDAPFIADDLFKKIADECGRYNSYIRLTGGGEPLLHPHILDLLAYAKGVGARIGLITNGSLLSEEVGRKLLSANTDVIEVSIDAADQTTYSKIRVGLDFETVKNNVVQLIQERNRLKINTKIIVSVINQKAIEGQVDKIVKFWSKIVDNVQIRKYLTWNILKEENSADPTPYLKERVPCPWPFERLNIDTKGKVLFCGYDIAAETNFGNVKNLSIEEIWRGRKFNQWRELILEGKYESISVCRKCSDWRYRSWNYNYWYLLKKAEKQIKRRLI